MWRSAWEIKNGEGGWNQKDDGEPGHLRMVEYVQYWNRQRGVEKWREILVLTGKKSERQKEFTVGGSCKLDNAYSLLCKTAHEDICIKPPAFWIYNLSRYLSDGKERRINDLSSWLWDWDLDNKSQRLRQSQQFILCRWWQAPNVLYKASEENIWPEERGRHSSGALVLLSS